jgi:hypothetical protein
MISELVLLDRNQSDHGQDDDPVLPPGTDDSKPQGGCIAMLRYRFQKFCSRGFAILSPAERLCEMEVEFRSTFGGPQIKDKGQ